MSRGELERVEVMGRVKSGNLRVLDAAAMLELSYRQTKRLWRRYREAGSEGLKHGNAFRMSNRGAPKKLRRRVLQLIQKKYSGSEAERFGPTLAAEHWGKKTASFWITRLCAVGCCKPGCGAGDGSARSIANGASPSRILANWCSWTAAFMNGWEGRGPRGCLMNMVDDATSTTEARMGKEETIWAAVGGLRAWIAKHGVPRALYTDWKNVYKRKATSRERLRGEVPVTQFGRMCEKLGIRILAASSPQAKGRVERNHGTHQDRLIKKMRRQGITSYEAANQYLEQKYLPQHNRRFARPPAQAEDYHGRRLSRRELRAIFRLESTRSIGNDWVVRYEGRWLQLHPRSRRYGPTKSKALVCEYEDGLVEVYYRGERIGFREIAEPVREVVEPRPAAASLGMRRSAKPDHPWRLGHEMRVGMRTPLTAPPVVQRPSASP